MLHLTSAIETLKTYKFEEDKGSTRILYEPIGVVGMITPWNWPINQVACKVAPAPGHRLHHGAEALRGIAVLGAPVGGR